MGSDQTIARKMEWGPWVLVAIGALLLFAGVERFVVRHRFGWIDALYCCLAVIPAWLLLLVFDYVLHHAKFVAVIPLSMAGVLAFSSPVWDVALGMALVGAMAVPAVSDWKYEQRARKSTREDG